MTTNTATVTVRGILAREPIARSTDTGDVVTQLRLVRVNTRALGHGVHITDATSMVDVECDGRIDPFWLSFVNIGDPILVTDATRLPPAPGVKAVRLRANISNIAYCPSFAD